MKKALAMMLLVGATFLTGCGSSENFVVTNNNIGVSAPVCVDDAYTANSNTALTVAAANGVLANDTPNGATLTFQATSAQGGTVTGAQDGSFTYTPAVNFTGTDTFTYMLGNSGGVVTCTVTITVNAVNGFFVDATNGNDTTGSFTNGLPFATVQAAVTAAGANSDIVVRPGSYTGQVNLLNGQRLLGSGSVLAQGTPVRPTLTGPIVLADGNTVDYIRIANAPDDAIDGDGQNGGTVTNCQIDTTTGNVGSGIQAQNVRGNWTISNNTIANALGAGIDFRTSGADTAVAVMQNNQITNNAFNAIGFGTSDGSNLRAQITGNTMSGNQAGFTFEVVAGGTSTSCYDIANNNNDDTYRLTQNAGATGPFQVEEYNNLIAVNNNSGVVVVGGGGTPPASVTDGTCGF